MKLILLCVIGKVKNIDQQKSWQAGDPRYEISFDCRI